MRLTILVAAALFVGLAQTSFASTITNGFFDISGTFYVTAPETASVVTPAGTCPTDTACLFWQDSSATNDQLVDISASGLPNGNIPLAIAGNDAATIANLENPPDVVGSTISLPTFMTFLNGGVTTTLDLTFIDPGFYPSTDCSSPPAVGQVCTVPGSMVNFVNNPPATGQATASWVFQGTTNTPGITWTGNFTSQFPENTPYQTVLSDLTTNGYVANTFSATISLTGTPTTTTVPEPGSLGLMMISTGLIATFVRRRSAK